MDVFFIKAAQLLVSLSLLIIVHEMGHFFPARWFNTRVEKFYLFFNPWFSIFKVKRGDTTYGLGWLPLGGYVKISGMMDESMDKDALEQPPQPWEFRSKPTWQRLIIMVGGVVVNLIVGVLIYSMLLMVHGEKHLPTENLTDGVWVTDSLGNKLGFETGDKIIAIDDEPAERFGQLFSQMISGGTVKLERDGKEQLVSLPPDFIGQFIEAGGRSMLRPRIPFIINQVDTSSANYEADIDSGDVVAAINGREIKYFDEARAILKSYKGTTATITLMRNGQRTDRELIISEEGRLGVYPTVPSYSQMHEAGLYEFDVYEYNFFTAFPAGVRKAVETIEMQVVQLRLMAQPETGAYKGVGGFGAIGGLFPAKWNWTRFWEITALLSLILAFMNILPIPALDGGHVMFLLYEMVIGKPPHKKFMEYAQIVGIVMVLSLVLYANGNDALKAINEALGN